MEPHVLLSPDVPGSDQKRNTKLPLQYYYVKQVIGTKNNKPVFMKKVLAIYPKGLKIVHATTGTRTVKELEFSNLLKFIDIREFQYLPDKCIFRFFYRNSPSNDPLPLATDLQYEFELALVSELNQTIDAALTRLAEKRRGSKRKRSQSLAPSTPASLYRDDGALSSMENETIAVNASSPASP